MLTWFVSASMALAAPACEPVDYPDWIAGVRERGSEASYLCLAHADGAATVLLEAIATEPTPDSGRHRRLQRALALHVMQRLDAPADVVALRALNASDRRLLRDAVHARRGRASPVAEHEAVFEQFDWYQPDPRYTNRALEALDQANLVLIDRPPAEPKPPAETDSPALAALPKATGSGPRPANTAGGCGCAATGSPSAAAWLVLPLVGLLRRRAQSSVVETR